MDVHTCGLMYTGMLGDGDSKAYQAVVDLEPYGPDVTIERRVREPCPQAHGNGSSQAVEAGEAWWTWTGSPHEANSIEATTILPQCDHGRW